MLASLLGIGFILDNIFIGNEQRCRIDKFINENSGHKSIIERFLRAISAAHYIVFTRYFGGPINSWKFMKASCFLSLFSLILVLLLQFLFSTSWPQFKLEEYQIIIFIIVIISNILIDYISIAQTKIFVEAAFASQSIFRTMLFMVADIIVTMNIFILWYAVFIAVVVIIVTSAPREGIYARLQQDWVESRPKIVGSQLHPNIYEGSFTGALFEEDGLSPSEVKVYFEVSSESLIPKIDEMVFQALPLLNVQIQEMEVIEGSILATRLNNGVKDYDPMQFLYAPKDRVERDREKKIQAYNVNVSGGAHSIMQFYMLYTNSFILADIIEDTFPSFLYEGFNFLNAANVLSNYFTIGYGGNEVLLCISGGGILRFGYDRGLQGAFKDKCDEYVTVSIVFARGLNNQLAGLGRSLNEKLILFNTLFITTLLPTLLMYLSIITVFFLKSINWLMLSRVPKIKKQITAYPFSFILSVGYVVYVLTS